MTSETDGVDLDALNYSPLIPYNGTGKQGANPLDFDVNLWYQVCNLPRVSFVFFSRTSDHTIQAQTVLGRPLGPRAPATTHARKQLTQC